MAQTRQERVIEACEKGNTNLVKELITSLNFKEKEIGLCKAIQNGHLDIVKIFFKNRQKWHDYNTCDCFTEACEYNQKEILEFLFLVYPTGPESFCPLSRASACGHTDIVKMLLTKNEMNSLTLALCLIDACKNGYLETVQYLLSTDAMKSVRNPLKISVSSNNIDIVKAFVKNGAVELSKLYFDECLKEASGNIEIVRYILSLIKDRENFSEAIISAVQQRHFQVAVLLINQYSPAKPEYIVDNRAVTFKQCEIRDLLNAGAKFIITKEVKVLLKKRADKFPWKLLDHVFLRTGNCAYDCHILGHILKFIPFT